MRGIGTKRQKKGLTKRAKKEIFCVRKVERRKEKGVRRRTQSRSLPMNYVYNNFEKIFVKGINLAKKIL